MDWTQEKIDRLPTSNGFHIRSESMTRMEVFSDTAFAFAMTMLVVSVGKIPSNHAELILALKGIPAFLLSFALIALFWSAHRVWSQRYGLNGGMATFLTLTMIFSILVFVYPLRLIFAAFCNFVSGGWLPTEFEVQSIREVANLFVIYGIAYAIMSGIFVLIYLYTLRCADRLYLTELEFLITRQELKKWLVHPIFGLLSAGVALWAPPTIGVYSGFLYIPMGILTWVVTIPDEAQIKKLRNTSVD